MVCGVWLDGFFFVSVVVVFFLFLFFVFVFCFFFCVFVCLFFFLFFFFVVCLAFFFFFVCFVFSFKLLPPPTKRIGCISVLCLYLKKNKIVFIVVCMSSCSYYLRLFLFFTADYTIHLV